jgi:uncharacterized repeat protein (TIGR01451 family)
MNKSFFTAVLFCFFSLTLFAQTNITDEKVVKWEVLNDSSLSHARFRKYEQVGNKILAETYPSYTYTEKYLGSDYDTKVALKYLSEDYGKTWRLILDINNIKANNASVMVYNNNLRFFRVTDDVPFSAAKVSLNNTKYFYKKKIYVSDDNNENYSLLTDFDTDIVCSLYGGCFQANSFDAQLYSQDSIVLRRQLPSGLRSNHLSIDGGLNWFYINYDDRLTKPFETPFDFAANGLYGLRQKDSTIHVYKYPNFIIPSLYLNGIVSLKRYSILEKENVFYVYLSDGNNIQLRQTKDNGNTWIDTLLPFNINNNYKDESAIYQDREQKNFYLISQNGIYRSTDPSFSSYKKIREGRVGSKINPVAFSILPSGIYMNDTDGTLIRSIDKGDTWEKVTNANKYVYPSLNQNFFAFDSTLVFNVDETKSLITKNLTSFSVRSDSFKVNGLNLNNISKFPIYSGLEFGKTIFIDVNQSNDNGKTWTSKYPNSLIKLRSDSSLLYYLIIDNSRLYPGQMLIVSSKDSGKTWVDKSTGLTDIAPRPITAIKNNQFFYYHNNAFLRSKTSNYQEGYDTLRLKLLTGFLALFVDNNTLIAVENDGSIHISNDNGDTWKQTYRSSFSPSNIIRVDKFKKYILLKTQNSTLITTDYGLTFTNILNFPPNNFVISGRFLYTLSNSSVNPLLPMRIHIDSILNSKVSNFSILRGYVLKDVNNNCKNDSSDITVLEKIIRIEPNGFRAITNKNGYFAIALPPDIYTVSTTNIRYYAACNDTLLNKIQLTYGKMIDTSFLFKPISNINDLALSLTAETPARPGFEVVFNCKVDNLGTMKADSAVVTLRFPTAFAAFVSVDQGGIFQNGQVIWNLKNQAVDENRQFKVRLKILPTTPLSTNLSFTGKVTLLNKNDTLPQNNEDVATLRVTGSYDPNDKSVLPEGKIPFFTNELDYLIRFQNTGTDTAFKVVVVDTLPSNVDVFTMKTVSSSHPYTVSLKKNIVTFTFDNILLVDSFKNEKLSHGFVRFKIAPKQGMKIGDSIYNKAAIYFDFNKPIITNFAKTNLIKPVLTISRNVNLCKGSQYKGITYNATTLVTEPISGALYDTVYLTTVDVKPTYRIQKDTLLKPNELFEGRVVVNGEVIVKSLKTKEWGCDSSVTIRIQKLTATDELPEAFSSIKIYPNPAKDYISISYELNQAVWVEISLYNEVGQKVKILQKKTQNTEGGYQLQSDLKNLNSGTYQIEIQTEKGVYYQRFVKM